MAQNNKEFNRLIVLNYIFLDIVAQIWNRVVVFPLYQLPFSFYIIFIYYILLYSKKFFMFLIKLMGEERFELSRPQESANFESALSTIPTFSRLNKIWYPSKDLNLHFIRFELIASAVGLEGHTGPGDRIWTCVSHSPAPKAGAITKLCYTRINEGFFIPSCSNVIRFPGK